jgi:hypothetical protein
MLLAQFLDMLCQNLQNSGIKNAADQYSVRRLITWPIAQQIRPMSQFAAITFTRQK